MELDAVDARGGPDRLGREIPAGGEAFRACRAVEAVAMPLIDRAGPGEAGGLRMGVPGLGDRKRVIADLGPALAVGVDARAHLLGQHLGAEADAEERRILLQAGADPVDLGLDEIVRVVGAHRAAEDHGAGMVAHRLRQRVAEARLADVEGVAAGLQQAADAAGGRMLLMEHDEDRLAGGRGRPRAGGRAGRAEGKGVLVHHRRQARLRAARVKRAREAVADHDSMKFQTERSKWFMCRNGHSARSRMQKQGTDRLRLRQGEGGAPRSTSPCMPQPPRAVPP